MVNQTTAFECVHIILDEELFYFTIRLYLFYIIKFVVLYVLTQFACFRPSRLCLTVWWFLGLTIEFAVKCGFAEYQLDSTLASRITTIFRIAQIAITLAIIYWRYNCPEGPTDQIHAALLLALSKHNPKKEEPVSNNQTTSTPPAPQPVQAAPTGPVEAVRKRGRPKKT